jgi:hypothetical protein
MKLGIVGHDGLKFTPEREAHARSVIRGAIALLRPEVVISGACHLGGVDICAAEEARKIGVPVDERTPNVRRWDGHPNRGYKQRNLEIAERSDHVMVIVVATLPPGYDRSREVHFESCYHCGPKRTRHVKSGACWTAKMAAAQGKATSLEIIP